MANLGVKVEDVLKRFYDVQQNQDIKGLYEIRNINEPNSELLWYVFNSNNATYHSSGKDCVIRDINQSNSGYIERLKKAFEKAKKEEKKIFWLVLVFGDGIGLDPKGYDWIASIELKVDLDSITASLSMRNYPIGGTSSNAWKPCMKRIEQDRYFNTTFMSCKDENGQFTSKYMDSYFEIYDNRPFRDVVAVQTEQQELINDGELLPSEVKLCAKRIIECIYDIDEFKGIKELFKKNTSFIKINIPNSDNLLPSVFALPTGSNYEIKSGVRPRVFSDKTYEIALNGENNICRLTTEWDDAVSSNNNLNALIDVVNSYYKDIVKIDTKDGKRYIHISNCEFSYKKLPEFFRTEFARRYITSLLAKPFVILTGNSGTGKTRISKQFSEYLECEIHKKNEEGKDIVTKNWMIVPVGADWTDNSKVLGFYNPLGNEGTGKYEKTKIIELIEDANANPTVPFFLVLDEMNLSHVERYFADFLSHMETPDISFELDGFQGELRYPDNMFVVGTVNIDETTYMFSPKVLDRANVIEFKPQKEEVLAVFDSVENSIKVNPAGDGSAQAFLKLAQESRKGILAIGLDDKKYFEPQDRYDHNVDYIKNVLEEIYEITEKSEFEFAYRTVKEIKNYISAAYELADLEQNYQLSATLDEQLVQKVLPKIHGNKKEIQNLLDELLELCEKYHFELSSKKITQMKGKLDKVQYASFI